MRWHLLPVLFHAGLNTFYGSVLNHVQLGDRAGFEMLATLLMTAVAATIVVTRPRLEGHDRGLSTVTARTGA